jgi:hypothetical protein
VGARKDGTLVGVSHRERCLRRKQANPCDFFRPEELLLPLVVEINDTVGPSASEERHGKDRAKTKRVDRGMEISQVGEGVGRDDDVPLGNGTASEAVRKGLLGRPLPEIEVAANAGNEAVVRGWEEDGATLSAGPQEKRIEDATEQFTKRSSPF